MNPAKYSLSWALDVVYNLRQAHVRATDIAKKLLNMSDKELATYLANKDMMFRAVKDLIHFIEKVDNRLESLHGFEVVYSYVQCKSSKETGFLIRNRVDSVQKNRKLEEQDLRGSGGRRGSAASPPPFIYQDEEVVRDWFFLQGGAERAEESPGASKTDTQPRTGYNNPTAEKKNWTAKGHKVGPRP